jgi:hypothetical protein
MRFGGRAVGAGNVVAALAALAEPAGDAAVEVGALRAPDFTAAACFACSVFNALGSIDGRS